RGRANHDLVFRLGERFVDLAAKVSGAGEFVAIAEDRIQPARNGAVRGGGADQSRRHAVRFQRLVQPIRPRLVAVAVADEGAIGESRNRRLGHGRLHITGVGSSLTDTALAKRSGVAFVRKATVPESRRNVKRVTFYG